MSTALVDIVFPSPVQMDVAKNLLNVSRGNVRPFLKNITNLSFTIALSGVVNSETNN